MAGNGINLLKKILRPSGLKVGLLATLLAVAVYAMGVKFFHTMELKAFDLHLVSRGKAELGGEVVIIAIDEKSQDEYGRWPWPRRRIARLVEVLGEAGAGVVAFDIVFSEPEERGLAWVAEWARINLSAEHPELVSALQGLHMESGDVRLAAALAHEPRSILGYFFFTSEEEIGHLSPAATRPTDPPGGTPFLVRRAFAEVPDPDVLEAVGVEGNLDIIRKSEEDFGFFNIMPDPDGIVRRVPLVARYGDAYYPHLSLEAVRMHLGEDAAILNVEPYGVHSISIGSVEIPTDERGYLLINYRGPRKTFPTYSFSDVAEGRVPGEFLKDKIVLVGATATGIYDMRSGPFSGAYAGVEIHANIVETILREDYIHRPDWVVLLDLAAIIVPGILLTLVLPWLPALPTALVTIGAAAGYIIFNGYIFNVYGIWTAVVYPVFTILFVSAALTTRQFMSAERKKKQLREAFGRYVSPNLVTEITRSPESLSLGGEERRLTVLFSDIRGFTTIAEGLSPRVLVRLMNEYLTPMTDIILDHEGTVDKYMGDSIMAFWGAPLKLEDHAAKACRASLAMRAKLFDLRDLWREMDVPELDIGIGISTGRLTVGNMGSRTRFDYTVLGDTVNLGARLESLNRVYNTHIIVPKYTYEDTKKEFVFRELDLIRVKGKRRPIKIYELMGERGGEDEEELSRIADLFHAALESYRFGHWKAARQRFERVLAEAPDDGPSKLFLERIEALSTKGVPRGWDGIYDLVDDID